MFGKTRQQGFIPLLVLIGIFVAGTLSTGAYVVVVKKQASAAREEKILELEKRLIELESGEKTQEKEEKAEQLQNYLTNLKEEKKVVSILPQIFEQKKPDTYVLPSGAIMDASGNIIQQATIQQTKTVELTNAQISSKVIPSVVHIQVFTTSSQADGSGFIIEPNGLILTAAHVVQGFNGASVILQSGKAYTAQVIGRDEFNDVALLKISANDLPYLTLGNSETILVGDKVLVFGHPLGLPQVVLSLGVLNGKLPGNNFSWLQTDAKTQGGSSGGPWINSEGEVIGIHVVGLGPTIQGVKVNEGFNFSVPSNYVKTLLSSLKQGVTKLDYVANPPVLGSTVEIKNTITIAVGLNPNHACENLGLSGRDLFLCKLYKAYPTQYKWKIVDEYSGEIDVIPPSNALSSSPPPAGSTIDIKRSVLSAILLNPNNSCDQMGLSFPDADKCKLYKTQQNTYAWKVLEDQ